MAFFLTLQTLFLLVLIHLSTCRSEGLSEYLQYPPESVNVSIHSNEQCLHIEWAVPLPAYMLNLKMTFQIDIRRSANSDPVEDKNYTTTLKPNETLQWCWHSMLPLQCISHSVRIRSMIDDERFPESRNWSSWSKWEESQGQDSSGQLLIFPSSIIYAEEDSNVTFCCISRTDNDNMTIYFEGKIMQGIKLSPRVTMFEVNNIPFIRTTGSNAVCELNPSGDFVGTVLYIGGVLEEPKNFSCETRDLQTLNCTWDPGRDTLLPERLPNNYTLFEWYSKKKIVCNHRNWCIWQLAPEVQEKYNFTLMAENKLRKRRTSISFNVTQQVQPKHARKISVENISATEATLTWQMIPVQKKISFLCQIEVYHDGKVIQYNTSNSEFTLRELQPYMGYSTQVRCCTANHFWKWSEWSSKNFTTKEAAPSGSLDIWRNVQPVLEGYNVKLFWRPLPTFQANGKILNYSIVMEALGKVPKVDISFSESPSTEKIIDQQPYKISIKAINSAGSSTPSVIVVSGDTENRSIKEDRVNGTVDGIDLSWKPDPRGVEGYVVDWRNPPHDSIGGFQWKKFSPNTTNAVIKSAAFQPGVRYNFRIYGLSANHEAYLLEKKTGYTRELALDCKPVVAVNNLASTSLTLMWTDNCANEPQYGFFKGYHIYMKPEAGSCDLDAEKEVFSDNLEVCKYTVTNTEQKTFNVMKLQPNSTYTFEVKAFTGGGDSLGHILRVSTVAVENTNLLMTILFPLAFISLLLIIGLNMKIHWVKEKCFPDIPDPYKSSVLSLLKFKGSIHQAILNTNDCIPDAIEVINRPEISKTQGSSTLVGNEISKPAYLYLLPTGKDALDPQSCICFENFTYCQAASDIGSHIQMIPTDPIRSVEPPEHLLKVEKDYMGSLGNIPAEEDASLNYVAQLAPTMSGDKGYSSPNLPEATHCSEYKMQMVISTDLTLSLPLEGERPISDASLD
ncbi:oncostatin-M-specific receptor subunit beta isoform X1 [Monodelphis domestica]|uniref:oncostatin-M-specific receptor subunit beta isoform X1 n=1 Tax=Monodelphis domestica TaxID=13616 RepID=UPI0024E1AEDB|nr:oncostatin-M-specific receptor subunit beta isoform X1 [Monodelphis domestica]XP_007487493.2 oncostatin-M-specific receptor subunit beta isoform X1 [Monodelphis domestica]XP_007487494.2 oncostatin-M-specific receptor subunit beta isoform X1 [Monodelphis domestica]XP_016287084.2 oncostatin-M-specific receptor subunit beta isoform X1 [Monodelphis domestica]